MRQPPASGLYSRIVTTSFVLFSFAAASAHAQDADKRWELIKAGVSRAAADTHSLREFVFDECARFGWWKLALLAVFNIAAHFCVVWRVSRLFAGPLGTWQNTLRLYIYQWCLWLGVGGVLLLEVLYLAPRTIVPALLCTLAAAAIGALMIPMRVYVLNFKRLIGFAVLSGAINFFLTAVSNALVPTPLHSLNNKSSGELNAMMTDWKTKKLDEQQSSAAPAPTPAQVVDPAVRVQQLYANLQRERAELATGDAEAVKRFNDHVAEYNELRKQLGNSQAKQVSGRE